MSSKTISICLVALIDKDLTLEYSPLSTLFSLHLPYPVTMDPVVRSNLGKSSQAGEMAFPLHVKMPPVVIYM